MYKEIAEDTSNFALTDSFLASPDSGLEKTLPPDGGL